MLTFFELFRTYLVEWILFAMILGGSLHRLASSRRKPGIARWQYALLHGILAALLLPLARVLPFTPLFATQGNALWFFFVLLIFLCLVLSFIFLRFYFRESTGYLMFYILFLILSKITLSVLYSKEPVLDPRLYAVLDLGSIFLTCILLIALTYLFAHYELNLQIPFLLWSYLGGLLFPVSFLLFFIAYSTGRIPPLWYLPLVALILLLNLPVIYLALSRITRAYEERVRLERSIAYVNAELAGYEDMISLEKRIRHERHELKNNYFYIRMLLSQDRTEELQTYLDTVIGEQMDAISRVSTGNPLIDYVLNQKAAEAQKDGIKFMTNILVPQTLPVDDMLFCRILLNLLSNAIEASWKEPEKDIQIRIECKNHYLVCRVANKVSSDVLTENPELHTTKADAASHGMGIPIIRKAVLDAGGIYQTSMENGYFTAVIMLPMEDVPDESAARTNSRKMG